ncbi:Chitinase 4 [Rhodotorula kratochvilovae]
MCDKHHAHQHPPPPPLKRTRVVPALALALLVALFLVLDRPRLFPGTRAPFASYRTHNSAMSSVPRPQGKVSVGYFVNWGIYARGFKPENIPVDDLTHLLYSFAEVKEDGEVKLTDAWSDEQIHYGNDSWNDPGGPNLYGNLKQLYLLKQRNRHLKVLLSIGGWTYSEHGRFARPISTSAGRARFVDTAVKLVEDYGLDGLDVDFEYPQNDQEAQDYVALLKGLREGLEALQHKLGMTTPHGFELTIAAPCGPSNFEKLRVRAMDQYLSFWNLMAYDYAGSWDSKANHQANIFGATPDALSTDRAIRFFTDPTKGGVRPEKLVLGIPLYGRSFLNTDGPGMSFSGVGPGSWEAGSYDYKALPLPGANESFDPSLVAAACFNPAKREWVSYDTPASAAAKAEFLTVNGLGGAMYWELSGDRPASSGASLVHIVRERMERAQGGMDRRENWLSYPGSKWENLRGGMRE